MIDVLATAEFAISTNEILANIAPPELDKMPASRIPGRGDALFARATNGDFLLLLGCDASGPILDRQTESLRLVSARNYVLNDVSGGAAIEATFASVALLSGNDALVSSFGTLCGVLLAGLPAMPSATQIDTFLNDFARLFAPRHSVSREVIVGLWGELWLLSQQGMTVVLAEGWHEESTGRYDFSLPHSRIEVKTTESSTRVHSFALPQLEPQEKPTWVASITVLADQAGESLGDLLTRINSQLSAELRTRVARVALSTIAGDLESLADFRLAPSGLTPLIFVSAQAVPRVLVPENAPITDVHFRVDLTSIALSSSAQWPEVLGAEI